MLEVESVITYKEVPVISYTCEDVPPSISFASGAEKPTETFPRDEYIMDNTVSHV